MSLSRRFLAAFALAAAAAACGSSTTAPGSTACQLTNGKVQVVIRYSRDRTKISAAAAAAFAPTLALGDHGDVTQTINTDPAMTRVDDYTWTITVLVFPNGDVMSHGATVIDIGVIYSGAAGPDLSASPYVVSGVTANGVQIRKVTVAVPPLPGVPSFGGAIDSGYFGVDACGIVSA